MRLWHRALPIILVAVLSGACASRGGVPRPFPVPDSTPQATASPAESVETPPEQVSAPPLPERSAAVAESGPPASVTVTALEFLGSPYRNGGTDPSGFDCSGFVQYVFAQHGTQLPREVRHQYEEGLAIDLTEIREGDLVFFETVSRGASHVGIAVGNGRFVHAPSSRGVVRVEPYTNTYWARRFVGARRMTPKTAESPDNDDFSFPGAIRSSR